MTLQPVSVQNLSAPEILVLLEPGVPPREVLKAALKELRASGLILIEHRKPQTLWAWTAQKYLNFTAEPPQNAVLRRLVEQLRRASRHSENLQVVLRRLQEEQGADFEDYKHKTVLPSLVRQGLLEPHSRKILGLFSRNGHRHTPEGQRLMEQLQHNMTEARQIVRLMKDDPARVVSLMAGLGAAAILLPKLWHHVAEINRLLDQESSNGLVFVLNEENDGNIGSLKHDFASLDSGVDSTGVEDGGDG